MRVDKRLEAAKKVGVTVGQLPERLALLLEAYFSKHGKPSTRVDSLSLTTLEELKDKRDILGAVMAAVPATRKIHPEGSKQLEDEDIQLKVLEYYVDSKLITGKDLAWIHDLAEQHGAVTGPDFDARVAATLHRDADAPRCKEMPDGGDFNTYGVLLRPPHLRRGSLAPVVSVNDADLKTGLTPSANGSVESAHLTVDSMPAESPLFDWIEFNRVDGRWPFIQPKGAFKGACMQLVRAVAERAELMWEAGNLRTAGGILKIKMMGHGAKTVTVTSMPKDKSPVTLRFTPDVLFSVWAVREGDEALAAWDAAKSMADEQLALIHESSWKELVRVFRKVQANSAFKMELKCWGMAADRLRLMLGFPSPPPRHLRAEPSYTLNEDKHTYSTEVHYVPTSVVEPPRLPPVHQPAKA